MSSEYGRERRKEIERQRSDSNLGVSEEEEEFSFTPRINHYDFSKIEKAKSVRNIKQ